MRRYGVLKLENDNQEEKQPGVAESEPLTVTKESDPRLSFTQMKARRSRASSAQGTLVLLKKCDVLRLDPGSRSRDARFEQIFDR